MMAYDGGIVYAIKPRKYRSLVGRDPQVGGPQDGKTGTTTWWLVMGREANSVEPIRPVVLARSWVGGKSDSHY